MLTQLLYVSLSQLRPDDPALEAHIAEILSASYVNNERSGITGLLLYTGGYFCQLLEGEEAAVDAMYDKISVDPRHGRINLLFKRPTDWIFLPNFPMGCAGIESEPDSLIADAIHLKGWNNISEAAPAVLYALLHRVPQTDLVLQNPNILLSDELEL